MNDSVNFHGLNITLRCAHVVPERLGGHPDDAEPGEGGEVEEIVEVVVDDVEALKTWLLENYAEELEDLAWER